MAYEGKAILTHENDVLPCSLIKEQQSYVEEAEDQEKRVARFEEEGKDDWEIKQQVSEERRSMLSMVSNICADHHVDAP